MAFLRHSHGLRLAFCFALLGTSTCAWLRGSDHPPREIVADELKVKAAFLFNFAAFAEWPPEAFASEDAPFVVGIYGADPFGRILEETFGGETIRGRGFEVRRIRRGGDLRGCHIVFIGDSERANVRPVLARLRGQPTLTVANIPGFAQLGGMIEFTAERGRIRFRINQTSARESGVTLGSKLLRLAQSTF